MVKWDLFEARLGLGCFVSLKKKKTTAEEQTVFFLWAELYYECFVSELVVTASLLKRPENFNKMAAFLGFHSYRDINRLAALSSRQSSSASTCRI